MDDDDCESYVWCDEAGTMIGVLYDSSGNDMGYYFQISVYNYY